MKNVKKDFVIFIATQVTIGLQRTSYTVTEDNALVLVCAVVESGSIAGRTITVNYQTANDGAIGILIPCFVFTLALNFFLFISAPGDYTSVSGSFDMTDSNTVQCIPITIVSDTTTETDEECFTYSISTTSTTAGLTLTPTTATICISGEGGEAIKHNTQCYMITFTNRHLK